MSTVISIENVSKSYRLGVIGTGTLREDLQGWWHRVRGLPDPNLRVDQAHAAVEGHTLWALQNVSLEVNEGEVLGIIGRNGAGKSTLLKILSRVTAPSSGRIRVKGRVASLLEVGTGFHPELTGRENIFLNGAILGMTKAEVTRKFEEIVAFSEIEQFIDTPVKRYSSGMYVRLAFAVAAHLDPEILVVDEVLAVGDASFQKKCLGKMGEVAKEGRTVLFVSHNMGSVRNLCSQGVIIERGKVGYVGKASDAVDLYMQNDMARLGETCIQLANEDHGSGYGREVEFVRLEFASKSNVFATNQDIEILCTITGSMDVDECRMNATISGTDAVSIGSISSTTFFPVHRGDVQTVSFTVRNHNLALGLYRMSFSLGTGNFASKQRDFDIVNGALFFKIGYFDQHNQTGFSEWMSSWGHIAFQADVRVLDVKRDRSS